jgi:hypothetical protein
MRDNAQTWNTKVIPAIVGDERCVVQSCRCSDPGIGAFDAASGAPCKTGVITLADGMILEEE